MRVGGAVAVPHGARLRGRIGHEGFGSLAGAPRDIRHGARGGNRSVLIGRGLVVRECCFIAVLDQYPVRPAAVIGFRAHDDPGAVHPFAFHDEFQFAFGQGAGDILEAFFRRPVATIPEHDGSAAILALGDGALKVTVGERMVFDLHRQPPVFRVERGTLGNRPGPENAIPFQAQIEMQVACGVLLDDEAQCLGGHDFRIRGRLGGLLEIALFLIPGQL
jgi:hypothetical protein